MESKLKVIDTLSPALERYAALQTATGKTEIEAMEKIMAYIVDFAANKIPKGDRSKLMALMTRYEASRKTRRKREAIAPGKRGSTKAAETASKWRSTYAARIVWLSNYKQARTLPAGQFYSLVNTYVNRRAFALNLHRSGLYPAMKRLKSKRNSVGKLPDYGSKQPGKFEQTVKQGVISMLAEDWASARQSMAKGAKPVLGIAGLKPDAFDLALPQVEKMLTDWYNTDMKKIGAKTGVKVKT